MEPQEKRRFRGEQDASNEAIDASKDFDRWAQAVRSQMLNCLQKRSKEQRF
jgi:hypothetical protein